MSAPTTRTLTIIAQDPSIKDADGKILKTQVRIPHEELGAGPRGYRVHVVDYDASQRVLLRPASLPENGDPFLNASDSKLLSDHGFHAQNVYAIVMRLLARFEAALGRRISWGFRLHHLHLLPHAFAEANAYYSDGVQGLFFGYFPGQDGRPVFTCLSHDIVAHETAHALLDGLRNTYTTPCRADQAGFHEGFADIVALLSVFGLRDVVRELLPESRRGSNRVRKQDLRIPQLRKNALMGLAERFGQESSRYSDDCLRRAVSRPPRKTALGEPSFEECHLRGEILSAAVLNAFIDVWRTRLESWLPRKDMTVPRDRVVEDGADAADHLLTMCIRALDYCPVVDITFGDFLSALLTADFELVPDDGKYKYRKGLRKQFSRWGIDPASGTAVDIQHGKASELGVWEKPESEPAPVYHCVHRASLERSPDEVFRFLWENRTALGIYEDAYTWVISVRPCVRIAPDGFVLNETVAEYRQSLERDAHQLRKVHPKIKKPEGMPNDARVCLQGGGVLVFDEFARLKYHVRSKINNPQRQNRCLEYLWKNQIRDEKGRYGFTGDSTQGQRFALMHRRRDGGNQDGEEWDG